MSWHPQICPPMFPALRGSNWAVDGHDSQYVEDYIIWYALIGSGAAKAYAAVCGLHVWLQSSAAAGRGTQQHSRPGSCAGRRAATQQKCGTWASVATASRSGPLPRDAAARAAQLRRATTRSAHCAAHSHFDPSGQQLIVAGTRIASASSQHCQPHTFEQAVASGFLSVKFGPRPGRA